MGCVIKIQNLVFDDRDLPLRISIDPPLKRETSCVRPVSETITLVSHNGSAKLEVKGVVFRNRMAVMLRTILMNAFS